MQKDTSALIYYKTGDIPKDKQHEEAYNLLLHALKMEYGIKELPEIGKTDDGKPYFLHSDICFNVSHTDGAVACIVSDKPCGIDIQSIAGSTRAARKVCSAKEQEAIVASAEQNRLFTRYWVLKEAFVKCIGTGIRTDLARIDFSECLTDQFMHENMHFTVIENDKFILAACIY